MKTAAKQTQRTFTDEFKIDAVRRFHEAKAAGTSIRVLVAELGIAEQLMYSWVKQKPTAKGPIVATPVSAPATTTARAPNAVASISPATAGVADGKRRQFSVELKQQCIDMVKAGQSVKAVADKMGIGYSQVKYWLDNGIKRGVTNGQSNGGGELVPAAPAALSLNNLLRDVLIFLRHAEDDVMDRIRAGKLARLDNAHLLMLQALESLKKAINS